MDSETDDGPPRALLVAAIVLAVGAVIAVLVVAALRQSPPRQQAVPVVTVPAPQASGADCGALTAALPESLGDVARAPLAEPAPPGAAAWRADGFGHRPAEPIVLRCGLERPPEFVAGVPLQVVDDVQWFRVGDRAAAGRSTWYAVDRPVYVALTLPPGAGPAPIQQISGAIADTLPAEPVDPAPVR